jgi:ABC-type dipeptide/oligopeptide/nickel transport system permease subunit
MDVGFAIEWIAGLGFIGLGVNPPTPEWGSMIATSHEYILTAWWYVTFPSLALMIVVVGFNSLGGALDEHAANVSRSGRRSRWPLARHSTLLIDSKTKEMR